MKTDICFIGFLLLEYLYNRSSMAKYDIGVCFFTFDPKRIGRIEPSIKYIIIKLSKVPYKKKDKQHNISQFILNKVTNVCLLTIFYSALLGVANDKVSFLLE